jgi:hypothetical protein
MRPVMRGARDEGRATHVRRYEGESIGWMSHNVKSVLVRVKNY